jgi:hypothetical protein
MVDHMSGDNLACKIRELRDENTILKSAYERRQYGDKFKVEE